VAVLYAATRTVRGIWGVNPGGEPHEARQNADELLTAGVVDNVCEMVVREFEGENIFQASTRNRIARAVTRHLDKLLGMQEGAVAIRVSKDGRLFVKVLYGAGNLLEAVWVTQDQCRGAGWERETAEAPFVEDLWGDEEDESEDDNEF